MEIKAIFLDIDDTLLDFDAYCRESIKSGFEKYGLPPFSEDIYQTFVRINTGIWHELEDGLLDFPTLKKQRWNRVFRELGISFDGVLFEEYFRNCLFESAIPVEGAMELLEYLHGKYLVCAASNGPYEQQVNRLTKAGMLPLFDYLFISEEIGASKPSKEFFDISFRRMNKGLKAPVRREEAVMIGDSLTSDIKGGKDAGMRTVWLNRKRIEDRKESGADQVVERLSELYEKL